MEQQALDEQHAILVLQVLLPQQLTLAAEKASGAKAMEIMSATRINGLSARFAPLFFLMFLKTFIYHREASIPPYPDQVLAE